MERALECLKWAISIKFSEASGGNHDEKTCFVIMPFSDMDGYEVGHFKRVYEYLIRPACVKAGLEPIRGDDVKATNYIAIDVIQRILKSDIVVCDLSGKNANVMYELGIRQAFDLPVVLMKDKRTERVFDIQGLRTLDYTDSLRIDSVEQDRASLTEAISATLDMPSHEVNSLIGLLGIEKASIGDTRKVSAETALVLSALKDISARITYMEDGRNDSASQDLSLPIRRGAQTYPLALQDGTICRYGDNIYDVADSGERLLLGKYNGRIKNGIDIISEPGTHIIIPYGAAQSRRLSAIPF